MEIPMKFPQKLHCEFYISIFHKVSPFAENSCLYYAHITATAANTDETPQDRRIFVGGYSDWSMAMCGTEVTEVTDGDRWRVGPHGPHGPHGTHRTGKI